MLDLVVDGAEPADDYPVWLVSMATIDEPSPSGSRGWMVAVNSIDGHVIGTLTLYS